MNTSVSLWIEIVVSALLLLSGVFTLTGALGVLRLKDFFQRMHPPALTYTMATWCVALASVVYFTALDSRLSLHVWPIIVLLSITVPITTVLLARAALFRRRQAGDPVPPPLSGPH